MRLLTTTQWGRFGLSSQLWECIHFFTQLQPERIIAGAANCGLIRSNLDARLDFLSARNLLFEANELMFLILVY